MHCLKWVSMKHCHCVVLYCSIREHGSVQITEIRFTSGVYYGCLVTENPLHILFCWVGICLYCNWSLSIFLTALSYWCCLVPVLMEWEGVNLAIGMCVPCLHSSFVFPCNDLWGNETCSLSCIIVVCNDITIMAVYNYWTGQLDSL